MKKLILCGMGLLLAGCSSGLQEAGFAIPDSKDGVHYIVNRSLVNSRMTANQPHMAGMFHCKYKHTSETMAQLRAEYGEHTWYVGCTPLEQTEAHKYVLTSDQSIGSLLQGPVSAAILGGAIGAGLALSGDDTTVNQTGGGAEANASSAARAVGKGGNVSVRGYRKW